MGSGASRTDGLIAFADRDGMVGTGWVRTGRRWRDSQILEEACALLGNCDVALDSGFFTADAAINAGNVDPMRRDDVSILVAFASTTLDVAFRGDAIISARRILAEIDLDAVNLGGHSTRLGCGRIYPGNDNPL